MAFGNDSNSAGERQRENQDVSNVVGVVDDILQRAVQCGASDVHFEPGGSKMAVKFRLDGVLSVIETLPRSWSENVVARLKVLAGLLTYRNDIPQEGRIDIRSKDGKVVLDQRVSVFPTIHGQRAVVRIFYEDQGLAELGQLGLSDYILSGLTEIAEASQGVLLLTGPAGSGKSTTLAAVLRHVLRRFPGKSIVALEDPVERQIEGVTQVQIPPHGEMTFPMALRSLLRQDPQVLMIGEIRDAETAKIAIEAGLTGHLLMSTMHSGSPAGALLRLLEMGVEPYQVTSSVTAIVNQRLVRRLCAKCKRRRKDDAGFEPVGCDCCFQTGFSGRVLIAEMVRLDGELRRAVLAKADMEQLEQLLKTRGHMTLAHDGRRLVASGVTVDEELQKACG